MLRVSIPCVYLPKPYCVFFFLFFSLSLYGQTKTKSPKSLFLTQSINRVSENTVDDDFTDLYLDHDVVREIYTSSDKNLDLNIPLDRKSVIVRLKEKTDLINPEIILANGDQSKSEDLSRIKIFSGQVAGEKNSKVLFLCDERQIFITYYIGSQWRKIQQSTDQVYSDGPYEQMLERDIPICHSESDAGALNSLTISPNRASLSYDQSIEVGLHLEVDYPFYTKSNFSTVETYMAVTAMYANLRDFYATSLNVDIVLISLKIWNTPDPFSDSSDISTVLKEFSREMISERLETAAMLVSGRRLSATGVAYYSTYCDLDSQRNVGPYSISSAMSSTTNPGTALFVMAHELGHTFGAAHTHTCVWNYDGTSQIDDCGNQMYLNNGTYVPNCVDTDDIILPNQGTVMSYCHIARTEDNQVVGINLNQGFSDGDGLRVGSGPKSLIRYNLLTASCDLMPDPLAAPIELNNFSARPEHNHVLVEWTTSMEVDVSSITLQHSEDGLQWSELDKIDIDINSYQTKEYQYTDSSPKENNLYRLLILNRDGTEQYSSIVTVNLAYITDSDIYYMDDSDSQIYHISIADVDKKSYNNWFITVVDASGKNYGRYSAISDNTFQIDYSGYPSGVYFLRIQFGQEYRVHRFVRR